MGFSHLGAALSILIVNLTIVCLWLTSWLLGASVNLQTHIVLALGVLATFVFYKVMKAQQNSGPLDEDGYPTPVEENSRDAIPKHTVSIPSEIQGMTFVQDMIVLSRSYGPHDARLMVYEYTDVYDLSDLTDNNCLYSGVLPPYLEQICADGNDLYLVFESSAERYRSRKGSLPIDCVLRIDVSDFYETHASTTSARKG
jgi:hypothetical protein